MFVVARCNCVKVERDGNNNASKFDAPLIVPHELKEGVSQHFISNVLNVYQPHFDRFWSEEEIDDIEAKQCDLIKRYNIDQHIKQTIDLCLLMRHGTRLTSLLIGCVNSAMG